MELACSRVSGMVITDIPVSPPSLDACATCVVGKTVHLPHKVGQSRASGYLELVHIDINLGPNAVNSVRGQHYQYIVNDHTSQRLQMFSRQQWIRSQGRKS